MVFDNQARRETIHLKKPRCRVCAQVLKDMDNNQDRLCKKHDNTSTTTEAALGKICMKLQDALEAKLRQTLDDRWEAYPDNLSSEQQWWWTRMLTFTLMCETSFFCLWHLVISQIIDSKVIGVADVREIQFRTADYYGYWHCVYFITLKDGSEYVFDPTGVQFGPQWPLLSPLDNYKFRIHYPWDKEDCPLGHAYNSLDEGFYRRDSQYLPTLEEET